MQAWINVDFNSIVVSNVIVIVVLAVFGIEDIRSHSIGVWQLVAAIAAACVYRWMWERPDAVSVAAGALIIAGVSAYCGLTGKIGAADVILMAFVGIMKGVTFMAVSSVCAMVLASVFMLVGIVWRKMSGKREVAFVPFLAVGTLGVMLCG